jgi:tetratricopeptide (TPR) repeat protein
MIAGAIALARRNLQSALDDLRYACHAEPSLPSVHTLLGMALFRLGQWDAAEDAFREAAQQNPADAQARDGLAAVFLRQGEYEDAADWALRALEQDMKLFRAHYHLGVALAHLDRPKEAVAALETSARIDPSRAAPFYWLSRVAARQLHDAQRGGQYQKIGRERVRKRRSMNRTELLPAGSR